MKRILLPFLCLFLFFNNSIFCQNRAQDSIALRSLYLATDGQHWTHNTNWLSGPINNWYGVTLNVSKRVYRLNLSNNGLTGVLPDSIGKLNGLTWLYLDENNLSGAIPDTIGHLANLTILDLSDNQLSGVVPEQIGNLSNLTSLSLDMNLLSGDFPDISGIAGLSYLSVTENLYTFSNLSASGLLPDDIEVFQYTPQDTILSISHNISNWTLTVEVENDPGNNYDWYKDGSPISEATRTITPPDEGLYNCLVTNASFPELTLYSDTLDFLYSHESDSIALVALYDATNGPSWSTNTNWLTGDLDTWFGIILDGEQRVSKIELNGNKLKGTLPPEVVNLLHLISLKIDHNKFSGDLPYLKRIETLDTILVENNLFIFSNLSSSEILPGDINSFVYTPQDTILSIGYDQYNEELTVEVTTDTGNIYTWYLDNVFHADTARTIKISEEGSYNCEVTNSFYTGLKLLSDTVDISFSIVTDSLALVHLYNDTDGPNWKNSANKWLTGRVSSWYGVTVAGNRVSKVLLGNNGLTGTIPSQIGNLTHLIQLNLSSNQLSDSIPPEIGNLTLLTMLKLNSNQLSGNIPAEIWNLDALTNLNLEFNQLTGTIPVEISNLIGLTSLKLSNNKLTGVIPVEIGDLTNLTWLSLYNNQLTGAIPIVIGDLTLLTGIELDGNELTGTIPVHLCDLEGLIRLSLSRNQLSGTIPTEFEQLTHLNYLSLGDNQLTGIIPSGIGELSGLTDLLLQNNQLSDSIPSEIGYLTSLNNLNLKGNQLAGPVPLEIENLTSLIMLRLDSNRFIGDLPPLNSASYLSEFSVINNQFTFSNLISSDILPGDIDHFLYAPQDTILGLEYALASGTLTVLDDGEPENAFTWYKDAIQLDDTTKILTMKGEGSYNCEVVNPLFPDLVLYSDTFIYSYTIATDSIALVTLFDETDGSHWTTKTNWKTGPLGSWYGVTLDGSHRVSELRLNGNHLIGTLPSEIGNLTHLTLLYLHNNTLSGSIPSEISELNNLIDLRMNNNQLTGSIPVGIGELTSLTTLYLNNNQLSGAIPAEIGSLTDLTYLSLNSNQLTGAIPAEIRNLILMQTLNLSQNQLSENIPSEMGDLSSLQYLYLSNNQLSGSIPSSFGDLSTIRTLNISGNELSGNIPAEIENLDNLSTLNIANNNFHFRTIEPIFGWSNYPGFSSFVYSPQKKIGLTQTIPGYIDYPLTIGVEGYITGDHDAFKWYKNSVIQTGETDSILFIPVFAESDTGVYHCVVSNSVATLLTLTSNDITVESVGLVITAGGLAAALTPEEKDTITKLTLIGTIDARDFKTMRDDMPLLAELDLSRVTVVAYNGPDGTSNWGNYDYPANKIPEFAFCYSNWQGKTSLISIIFPTTINTIGQYSFHDCSGLLSVYITSSITSIGSGAFARCSGFITVDESNPNYSSIDGVLFNKNQTTLIQCPTSKIGSYIIQSSVTLIENGAFMNCSSLTSVTFPSSVTSIGYWAFSDCSGLTSIYASAITPVNLDDWSVFNNVNKNTCTLHVPYGTSALYAASYLWQDFTNIVEDANGFLLSSFRINFTSSGGGGSINIHANVDWTASYIQDWYTVTPTSGNSDTTLSFTASANTVSLTRTDTVTVSSPGKASQTIIVFQEALPKSLEITAGGLAVALTIDEKNSINDLTLTGAIDARDFKTMRDSMPLLTELNLSGATIVTYNGPDGTSIWGNTSYPADAVPEFAFLNAEWQGKTSLHSIVLPATLTSIERYAFRGCSGLTGSLMIPNLVTSIGFGAFGNCSGLTGSLTIPNSVTSIADEAFWSCSGFNGSLTIPNLVTSIGNYAFAGCSGFNGSLTIPNSVTSLGNYAFSNCYEFSGSLMIPNSVILLGDGVFNNCWGFSGSLTISNSATSIGDHAFYNCSGFNGSLIIGSSVTSIGDYAFIGCRGLNGSLSIPNSVTSIGNNAFQDCLGFTGSLTIPNSVTSIGVNAFWNCSGFTGSLTISNSVTSIEDYTFGECYGLTSVVLPDFISTIGWFAFGECSDLTTLNIPSTITSIAGYAFQSCSGLSSIYSNTTVPVDLSSSPYVFIGVDTTNCTLYVPYGTSALYAAASQWQDFIHIVEMPENDVEIINSVSGVETPCFDAYNTITVAGGGHTVVFESGSEVTLIAGQSILFLPGFHAQSGSYMDAYITTDATFCNDLPTPGIVAVEPSEKSVIEENIQGQDKTGAIEKSVKIFPNPNNGIFTVGLSNFNLPARISIVNIMGVTIYPERWISSDFCELNLPGIDKGMYFVRINDGKSFFSKKIIVQ